MDRILFSILSCFIIILSTGNAHAMGLLYRVQQARQHPAQQQEQPEQSQQANTELTYQQTIDQRNQAIAQAILDAHNPSVISNEAAADQAPQAVASSPDAVSPPSVPVSMSSTQVQDEVDLSEVWKKLDKKATVWTLLIDDQAKLLTVSEYINRFQNEGVKINQSAAHYVAMIDQMIKENPGMLDRPFGELLQIMAIIDYDFDNGMNKDDLARKILGEAGYEANKKRLTGS